MSGVPVSARQDAIAATELPNKAKQAVYAGHQSPAGRPPHTAQLSSSPWAAVRRQCARCHPLPAAVSTTRCLRWCRRRGSGPCGNA
eukprot:366311-Chlamydomonas_euryale.AAC.8